MEARPYILKETSLKAVQQNSFEIAVLPWGATEAHNYHLPYGTDIYEAEYIAAEAAGLAWEKNVKLIVLPAVPFGVNTQQLDIPLTINMNPSTQSFILEDVIESLEHHSIEKLVILNSHGGNNFRQMVRELQRKTDIFLCTLDWFKIAEPLKIFDEPGDHAGEMETSLLMHFNPELVRSLNEAGDGSAKKFSINAFNQGWAWAPRQWTSVTNDTGVGNPAQANAEKGKKYLQEISQIIADFFVELSETEIKEMYK
ncbi:MAG: creatininase family protein [Calditrichae bacterium]|nr:creatininase family protein [Calditrichia bacterium]